MGHSLSITNGTTTISLSSGSWLLTHYTPNVPSYRNGAYDPVTDSIELTTNVATGALAQTAINAVQRLLEDARRRTETKSGARVYLQLTLDSDSATWRSEIMSGQLLSGQDTLRAWQGIQPQTLVVERAYYWEGAETSLLSNYTLLNSGGSNSVYSATTVNGVMPTPPIVTITNNTGASKSWRDVYFGINAYNDPASFDGSIVYSPGEALAYTAPYEYSVKQLEYEFSDAELAATQGDSMRFVGGFTGGFTDEIWWKLSLEYSGITNIANTQPIYAPMNLTTPGLLDFGAMRVPPGGYSTATTDVHLTVRAQDDTTNLACTLDTLQMFPASNTRQYSTANSVGSNHAIVDDGVLNRLYIKAGSLERDNVTAIGSPLMLYPGQGHRFIWLMRTSTGYAISASNDKCQLDIDYRPRRLTV